MLWKRFQEEIIQTKREMCNFIEDVEEDRKNLAQEIRELETGDSEDPFTRGLIVYKTEELVRLTNILVDAVLYFDVNVEDGLLQNDNVNFLVNPGEWEPAQDDVDENIEDALSEDDFDTPNELEDLLVDLILNN